MSNWQRLDTRIVYQNPHFTVHEDGVIDPDGKPTQYGWIETLPAVFIVATEAGGKVVLIKQLRYTTGQPTWELPGGNTEGEDPLDAAKRELAEEAGLHADKWVGIGGEFFTWSGMATQRNAVYVASGLHKSRDTGPTGEEIVGVESFTWAQLKDMMKTGELNEAGTITALTLAGLHLGHLK